ncbi:hypothetical protein TNCV_3390771 [Trichonephila clavipes]|nr:hypothetical protein TNCV_3390771 [Trichonephila clavipes]
MSSSPIPLKTRRVGDVKSVESSNVSPVVVVRRGRCQLSLCVKITDLWLASHECGLLKNLRVDGNQYTTHLSRLNDLRLVWCGSYEKEVPAQVSS